MPPNPSTITRALSWICVIAATAPAATGCLQREPVELSPCLVGSVDEQLETNGISRVDLLFVVDNSDSMAEEQAALRAQFPRLIELLTSGRRPDGRTFSPVKDLHLGVVSTDMGSSASWAGDKCAPPGDDGRLASVLNPAGDDSLQCGAALASSAPFLRYQQGQGQDPMQVALDFQCLATLGVGGCGYEQPLEAMLKALTPASLPDRDAAELAVFRDARGLPVPGHADGANAGFLRGLDATSPTTLSEDSLIAVVIVSDEEDCSVRDDSIFDVQPDNSRVNLVCQDRREKLHAVSRYVEGLRALRREHPERVIFAAITGVPESVAAARAALDLDDGAAVDAFYQNLLDSEAMQEVEEPHPTREGSVRIRPVCGSAAPARRLVEVARGFGRNGVVHSICQGDFGPALDAVVDAIVDQLPDVCLPQPLVPDVNGLVDGCRVFWDLPATPTPGQLSSCGDRGYLKVPSDRAPITDDGRVRCEVAQVAVLQHTPQTGVGGWHYDDFSADVRELCGSRTDVWHNGQRITFSERPGAGVRVNLQCSQRHSAAVELGGLPPLGGERPEIGGACGGDDGLPTDALCQPTLRDGSLDERMFCHPQANRCVMRCNGDDDCPASWVCDARPQTVDAAGNNAICTNPTCGG